MYYSGTSDCFFRQMKDTAMGFRFQKRITLAKAIRLVLSKTGVSISFGMRGLWLNVRRKIATVSIGIHGTGISYRKTISLISIIKIIALIFIALTIAVVFQK